MADTGTTNIKELIAALYHEVTGKDFDVTSMPKQMPIPDYEAQPMWLERMSNKYISNHERK